MTNFLIYDCPNCAFSWLVSTDSLGTQEDPNEYHPKSEVPKKKQIIVLLFKIIKIRNIETALFKAAQKKPEI